jgi:hypothetical protein
MQGPEPHLVLFAAVPGRTLEPESHGSQFPAHLPCIVPTYAFCVLQIKETHSQSAATCLRPFFFFSLSHTHFWTPPFFSWMVSVATCNLSTMSSSTQLHKTLRERERKGWRLSRCETLTLKLSKAVADSEAGSGRGGRGVDWNSQSCACGGLHQFPPRVGNLELLIFAILKPLYGCV